MSDDTHKIEVDQKGMDNLTEVLRHQIWGAEWPPFIVDWALTYGRLRGFELTSPSPAEMIARSELVSHARILSLPCSRSRWSMVGTTVAEVGRKRSTASRNASGR